MISIIFNPAAGNGNSRVIAQKAAQYLDKHSIAYEILETKAPGDATRLARAAAEYADIVVADGGDGTIREVVQGLVGTSTPLGILPGGRGNDFRRSIGVPNSVEEAMDLILNGQTCSMDLMEVNGEICVNIYSVGFDVIVADYSRKFRIFRSLSYYVAALYTCFAYRAGRIRIDLDGQILDNKYYLVCFGNGNQYGGGIKIMPNADNADGFLDVCVIENVSVLQVLRLLPYVTLGKHSRFKDGAFLQGEGDSGGNPLPRIGSGRRRYH